MTKYRFNKEKMQKKAVRTVWGMVQKKYLRGVMDTRSLHAYYNHYHFLEKRTELSEICKALDLVTVKQILKAIM